MSTPEEAYSFIEKKFQSSRLNISENKIVCINGQSILLRNTKEVETIAKIFRKLI